jgi:hypothetical protein
MTPEKADEIIDGQREEALARIAEIDKQFEAATGWGSWMVMTANERERLVNTLQRSGYPIEHKWLARCGGHPTD